MIWKQSKCQPQMEESVQEDNSTVVNVTQLLKRMKFLHCSNVDGAREYVARKLRKTNTAYYHLHVDFKK